MLKLEKRKRSQEVTVRLRDKDPTFDRPFLIAFGIAMGLHMFGFLLFHVSPFKVDNTNTIFAPILVNIDFDSEKEMITTETESDRLRKRHLSEPKTSELSLPEFKTTVPDHDIVLLRPKSVRENPFTFLEKKFRINPIYSPDISAPSMEILVSGDLAERKIVEGDLYDSTEVNSEDREHIVYQVQVEGKSGEIFWFEAKGGDPKLTSFAEDLLGMIRFESDPQQFVISGEIEIRKAI